MTVLPERPEAPSWRDGLTLRAYGMLACLGFALVGLGAVLPGVQGELELSPGLLAGLPTLFALWFVAVGLGGRVLLDRFGPERLLAISSAIIAIGSVLAALPTPVALVAGLTIVGLGGALVVVGVPAALGTAHPQRLRRALTEANALSVLAGMAAPTAVSVAVTAGLGWRIGYLLPLVLLALLGLRPGRSAARDDPAGTPVPDESTPAGPVGAVAPSWFGVVLAVMIEFVFTLWSGVAIQDWHATTTATAALGPLFFVAGMAAGRMVSAALDDHLTPGRITAVAVTFVVVGFIGFRGAGSASLGFAWLVVAGLGVAPLYPLTLTQLLAASSPTAGARWGAVASGTAIAVSPQILGRVADEVGLRTAFAIVPVLACLLVGQQVLRHRRLDRLE